MESSWEKQYEATVHSVPVTKYVSRLTGIKVVHAHAPGPIVHGYYVLATEAHDDDGCPHTLEHLVFLGSEDYPFKGFLDSVANRCLSRGTNAWTDVDHTAYTQSNVGSEGFLQLMPIYLDHILFPTITDSGFLTEVHHITGEGSDAGVVYCEMQGRENSAHSLAHLAMKRALFKGTGYASETGGIMANLRALNVEKVRQYHRDYYRPNNLCIFVCGDVEINSVFHAISSIEYKITSRGAISAGKRPWSTPVPAFCESQTVRIDFPAGDEDSGAMAILSFRGPGYADKESTHSLNVLRQYLTESAISELRRAFVDTEDAICANVYTSFGTQSVSYLVFYLDQVVPSKLDTVQTLFMETIRRTVANGIDMVRMQSLLRNKKLRFYDSVETRPADVLAYSVINDFLYANSCSEFEDELFADRWFDRLSEKPASFWHDLLSKWILDNPCCSVLATPSVAKGEEMHSSESQRLALQQQSMGPEALSACGSKLASAISENEKPTPESALSRVVIPDFTKVETFRFPTLATEELQLSMTDSSFVRFQLIISSDEVPDHLRLYLELLLDCIQECGIEAPAIALSNGTTLPRRSMTHEDVVRSWSALTTSHSQAIGIGGSSNFSCGAFAQLVLFSLKCDQSAFEEALLLLVSSVCFSVFTGERLAISVNRLLRDAVSYTREGDAMCAAAKCLLLFGGQSNRAATAVSRQIPFLNSVKDKIATAEGLASVMRDLEALRHHLLSPTRLRVHIVGKCDRIRADMALKVVTEAVNSLSKANSSGSETTMLGQQHVPRWSCFLVDTSKSDKGVLLSLPSVESSFMQLCIPGIRSFADDDIAPLTVAIECLTTLEGPFWKRIRGLGLSYSYAIRSSPEEGLINFVLFKSGSPIAAFEEARSIVSESLAGQACFSDVALQSAKAAVVFSTMAREENQDSAATVRLLSYYRKESIESATQEFLRRIQLVTVDDVLRVTKRWIMPLFQHNKDARFALVTGPTKVADVLPKMSTCFLHHVRVETDPLTLNLL